MKEFPYWSYRECPLCGYISNDSQLENSNILCSNCKKPANLKDSTGCQIIFPHLGAMSLLKMIEYFYTSWKEQREEKEESLIQEIERDCKVRIKQKEVVSISQEIEKVYREKGDIDSSYQETIDIVQRKINKDIRRNDAEEILMKIWRYLIMKIHEKNTIPILSCTLLEVLSDDFLTEFSFCKNTPYKIARKKVEQLNSINRKFEFFKKLTGKEFSAVLESLGFKDFLEKWDYIRKDIRNKFVHEGKEIKDEDAEKAYNLAIGSVRVFADLHNKFCLREIKE